MKVAGRPAQKEPSPPSTNRSDGWDDLTAYGHVHQVPIAAGDALTTLRLVARNSGLFYLSATHEALRLMEILAARMAAEDVWDQSAYNMEIFRPAYGAYQSAGVSVRAHPLPPSRSLHLLN